MSPPARRTAQRGPREPPGPRSSRQTPWRNDPVAKRPHPWNSLRSTCHRWLRRGVPLALGLCHVVVFSNLLVLPFSTSPGRQEGAKELACGQAACCCGPRCSGCCCKPIYSSRSREDRTVTTDQDAPGATLALFTIRAVDCTGEPRAPNAPRSAPHLVTLPQRLLVVPPAPAQPPRAGRLPSLTGLQPEPTVGVPIRAL
jgi:hypothetical protein